MAQISMPMNMGSRNMSWNDGGYGWPPVVIWTHSSVLAKRGL